MSFQFLAYKRFSFAFSGILAIAAIAAIIFLGLRLGIDFTGGSILEAAYETERPAISQIRQLLQGVGGGEVTIQLAGEKGVIARFQGSGETVRAQALDALGRDKVKELRFESIGPVIGRELQQKAVALTLLSLLAILVYITAAFRGVSWPLHSWQYGIAAILALFHDLLITLGFIILLGYFFQVSLSTPLVVALLTIAGYSINDTIVIFDRIRENLLSSGKLSFKEVINKSLSQTFVRSVNTYLTTILALLAIFFFGGQTLKFFALTLIFGIFMGAYSSIFIAAPLLTLFGRKS